MPIHCYSRRLMSPFQGTLQVITVDDAEAESTDGINWVIYLANEGIVSYTGLAEVRYGTWNAHQGIVRAKIQGISNLEQYEQSTMAMLQALQTHASQTPFPAIDHYEQWLLDQRNQQPLALLNTAIHTGEIKPGESAADWRPSQYIARHFQSPHGNFEDLLELVNQAAGTKRHADWFHRNARGDAESSAGELLPADNFPDPIISTSCFESDNSQLIMDYISWDAPALLQLATLTRKQRTDLEQQAWQHPQRVEQFHYLYPDIIDREGLDVTLVKARLIGKNDVSDGWREPFLPYVSE